MLYILQIIYHMHYMCNRHINCSTLKCHAQVFLHIICHHMLRTVLWNYYIRREESISWRRRMHLLARYTVTHTVQHIWSCIHSNTCTTIIIYMHDKWLYYFICTPAECNTSHASALQSLNIGVRHDYSTQSILHDHVHSTLILSCKLYSTQRSVQRKVRKCNCNIPMTIWSICEWHTMCMHAVM